MYKEWTEPFCEECEVLRSFAVDVETTDPHPRLSGYTYLGRRGFASWFRGKF